jgi:hypothetical protein
VLDAEAFDRIAGADVFVVLEGHAAFLADIDFRTSSLKRLSVLSLPSWMTTLSRTRRTPTPRSTLPSVDAATRDLADLRDVEHLEDLGIAEEGFRDAPERAGPTSLPSRHPPGRR